MNIKSMSLVLLVSIALPSAQAGIIDFLKNNKWALLGIPVGLTFLELGNKCIRPLIIKNKPQSQNPAQQLQENNKESNNLKQPDLQHLGSVANPDKLNMKKKMGLTYYTLGTAILLASTYSIAKNARS